MSLVPLYAETIPQYSAPIQGPVPAVHCQLRAGNREMARPPQHVCEREDGAIWSGPVAKQSCSRRHLQRYRRGRRVPRQEVSAGGLHHKQQLCPRTVKNCHKRSCKQASAASTAAAGAVPISSHNNTQDRTSSWPFPLRAVTFQGTLYRGSGTGNPKRA